MVVHFITQNQQIEVEIMIEEDKTVEELIKLFFKSINRPDLFGDKSIIFLYGGESLRHDSKTLIRQIFDINHDNNPVLVVGREDKL